MSNSLGDNDEGAHSASWQHSMAVKHMGKIRFEKDPPPQTTWNMQRMENFNSEWGGRAVRTDALPQWAEAPIAMLRMVEAHTEVDGLGFRYNEDVFYIDSDLEKEDAKAE